MRGIARRFWCLVALALAAEALVIVAAARMTSTVLPCYWAPARPAGWMPGAQCESPLLFVGYRSWVPVAILAGVVGVSVSIMVLSASTQLIRTRRCWRALHRAATKTPAVLVDAAGRAGLGAHRIVVVEAQGSLSFCRGLVFTQVVVSTALIGALGADQLDAVLAHEAAHATSHDPLRALIVRTLGAGLFFLPAIADLGHAALVDRELGADASACRAVGRTALVEALVVMLSAKRPALGAVAEMAGVEALDVRITALRTGQLPAIRPRAWPLVATSVVSAALCLAMAWLPGSSAHFVGGSDVHLKGNPGIELTPAAKPTRPVSSPSTSPDAG